MGLKGLLAAGAFSLAASCAHVAPSLPRPDLAIATNLKNACSDGLEHMVFYLQDHEAIYDVTKKSLASMVLRDEFKAQIMVKQYDDIIEAHCHVVDYDTTFKIMRELMDAGADLEDDLEKLKLIPRSLIDARALNEIPSSYDLGEGLGGDMPNALLSEFNHMSYRPEARMQHRIVIVRKAEPVRVISYGITEPYQRMLRDLVSAKSRHFLDDKPRSDLGKAMLFLEGLAQEYNALLYGYYRSRCNLWQREGCTEPDAQELMDKINATGKFFVREVGTLR